MFWWTLISIAVVLCAVPLAVWAIGERGSVALPSTRRVLREFGWRRVFSLRGMHLYLYGCWPRAYLDLLINHLFKRPGKRGRHWLADRYHGKVLTIEHARSLLTVERKIPLQDLEQIIPYSTARQLLLQSPPDVAVLECPCRAVSKTPCQPSQVCLIVGQPFVDLLVEHHPTTSRRITPQEALEILEAEHGRGHLHSAWFKDACLDRFFAICNCCKCCCGGIRAMTQYGIPMMASSGYVAEVDPVKCSVCGRCEQACPFEAIVLNAHAQVLADRCMGCGVCLSRCRSEAVSLRREPLRGTPLDVRQLTDS